MTLIRTGSAGPGCPPSATSYGWWEVLTAEGDELSYTYDASAFVAFNDGWRHQIVVDKIVAGAFVDKGTAVCLVGARAAPPEDCGGILGYTRFPRWWRIRSIPITRISSTGSGWWTTWISIPSDLLQTS